MPYWCIAKHPFPVPRPVFLVHVNILLNTVLQLLHNHFIVPLFDRIEIINLNKHVFSWKHCSKYYLKITSPYTFQIANNYPGVAKWFIIMLRNCNKSLYEISYFLQTNTYYTYSSYPLDFF